MKAIRDFYSKHKKLILSITICLLLLLFLMPFLTTKRVHLHTNYTDKEDVALYIKKYHELPPNYITKAGYSYLKQHPSYKQDVPYVIGGDSFFQTYKLESFGVSSDTRLKECDIAVDPSYTPESGQRGYYRFVYTCNEKHPRVFYSYTENEYNDFIELTSFKLQLPRNIFWIIFGVYAGLFAVFYGVCLYNPQKPKPELQEESSGS